MTAAVRLSPTVICRFWRNLDPMVPMLLVAALVGVASSIAVEGFRQAMDAVMRLYTTHEHLVAAAKALPPLALAAIPTLGATLEIAAILVAAVMGELTTQSLFATGPLYLSHTIPPVGFPDLLDATLLGVLAGVLGPAFLWLLDTARRGYQALVGFPPVRMGLMGLAIGLLSLLRPEVWGNGYSVVQSFLVDHWALSSVAAVLGLRLLATTAASAAGIPGGVLTPTLALGGALGLLVQQTMLLGGASHSQALWVLVGMGSLLAATTHAPAMSAIMVFEITRNYDVVLAAMPACVIGSVLGSLLRERSVYAEALGLSEAGERRGSPLGTITGLQPQSPPNPSAPPDTDAAEPIAPERDRMPGAVVHERPAGAQPDLPGALVQSPRDPPTGCVE